MKGIAKTWMEAALFGEPCMILMCIAKQTERCCLGSFQESSSFHWGIGVVKFEELREKAKPKWKAVVMRSKNDSVAMQHAIHDYGSLAGNARGRLVLGS